jgi:GTP cyclohydrolase II
MEEVGGWILYLRQEGRGIGLAAKLDAYLLQDDGLDTFEANRKLGFQDDERDYADAALMLNALGISEIDLLTGNPEKVHALQRLGIRVRRTVPCDGAESPANAGYLAAKRARSQVAKGVQQESMSAIAPGKLAAV